ncbi:hypothetical protein HMN09_00856900 [Mycena chlorophos]|uniref:F-box domain-containing protein n=1 Tax=Mycena chlorophos TaxID=658473 RepID=A0A8H6SUD2_MYCCL|nr:hypothetical protein HMN09_00856900 [Mycena chlorophos]
MTRSSSPMAVLPDELLLRIFSLAPDDTLFSLAPVSRHVHEMALLCHLERHGVSLADIEAGDIPRGRSRAPSCIIRALFLARFVPQIRNLRLGFTAGESLPSIARDLRLLRAIASRNGGAKGPATISLDIRIQLDVDYLHDNAADALAFSAALAELLVVHGIHPAKPFVLVDSTRIVACPGPRRHGPTIPFRRRKRGDEDVGYMKEIREETHNFLSRIAGEQSQTINIDLLWRSNSESSRSKGYDRLGALCVVNAETLTHFAPVLQSGSSVLAAIPEVLRRLTFPSLQVMRLSFQLAFPKAEKSGPDADPALVDFLCRHSGIRVLRLDGARAEATAANDAPPQDAWKNVVSWLSPGPLTMRRSNPQHRPPPPILPPNTLTAVNHLFSDIRLGAWLLSPASRGLPNLTAVTLRLHSTSIETTRAAYATVIKGIAGRPLIRKLVLQIADWAPWHDAHGLGHGHGHDPQQLAPECGLAHLAELHLVSMPSYLDYLPRAVLYQKAMVLWLERFPPFSAGLRSLTLWLTYAGEEELMKRLRELAARRGVQIRIGADVLPRDASDIV